MTLAELRERLLAEFRVEERPFSELSILPPQWNTSSSRKYWKRLIPPAKAITMQAPDIPEHAEVSQDLLLRVCLKLRINPGAFGIPWS